MGRWRVREVAENAVVDAECAMLRRYLDGIRGGGSRKKLHGSIEKLDFDIFRKACESLVDVFEGWSACVSSQ